MPFRDHAEEAFSKYHGVLLFGREPVRIGKLSLLVVLCALLVCISRSAAQDLSGLYLTWTRDPSTTMTVNWVDLYPRGTTTVFYRARGTADWLSAQASQKALEPSALQRRWVELAGLAPDTVYEFGIGTRPEKETDGWCFRTMPADLAIRPVRFVTGGDMMHSRAQVDAMNKQAAALDPDFALLGGDLAYENGVTATRIVDWLESWMRLSVGKDRRLIPMVLAIGNHEVRGHYNGKIPDDAPYFYGLFTLPEDRAYYALDFGAYLSLIVLDSGHTNPVEGPQVQFLEEAMSQRTDRQFLFACYHYPMYGTTKAPMNGLPIDATRSVAQRQHWMPIFEKYGLTAVFENDHHNFKRSHRLRNHQRDDENGLLYLGDGAWGVGTRDVPKPGEAWWLAKAASRNHLWVVDLHVDGTSLIRAIDVDGEAFDEVRIDKPRTMPVMSPATQPATRPAG